MSAELDDLLAQVEEVVSGCKAQIEAASDAAALDTAKNETLGRQGRMAGLMELLKTAPNEAKRTLGQRLNAAKKEVQEVFDARQGSLGSSGAASGPAVDLSLPGIRPALGARHPLKRIETRVVDVLASLGFEVAEGPEVEDDFHNFIALNIPEDHPARDAGDNFYLKGLPYLLRSQTSTVQIRTMETAEPPLRICAPGRVFRPDEVDATHMFMFHQVEGLAVDRGLTIRDLKGTLLKLFRSLFGDDVEIRLRPSFFPFTEPSAEVDVYFPGRGWIETGGCGMVDPAVFEAVNLDPDEWSGFAFGLGLERIAMRQLGVPDIRLFTENDVRFLGSL